jgi:hypothetical protein
MMTGDPFEGFVIATLCTRCGDQLIVYPARDNLLHVVLVPVGLVFFVQVADFARQAPQSRPGDFAANPETEVRL